MAQENERNPYSAAAGIVGTVLFSLLFWFVVYRLLWGHNT